VLYSREATVDKVVRRICELGHQGVQFATFPETVVPYYPPGTRLSDRVVPGRTTHSRRDRRATHHRGDADHGLGVRQTVPSLPTGNVN